MQQPQAEEITAALENSSHYRATASKQLTSHDIRFELTSLYFTTHFRAEFYIER